MGHEDEHCEDKVAFIKEFSVKHELRDSKAKAIYKSALKRNYIELIPSSTLDGTDKLKVLSDGYDLIYKRGKIPTGLVRAILGDNKNFIQVTTAVIITIATIINVIIEVWFR